MRFSDRLQALGPNVFAEMDRAKVEAIAQGQELIDLSLGSSDMPTPPHVLATIAQSLQDPTSHGYLLHRGTLPFRQAAADWYERKFGLAVDAETEVLLLIGSQEGTAHLPLALLNPGDVALLTDPGYPSHAGGVHLASGEVYTMPLRAENQFLPVFGDIPVGVLDRSRLMVLSYPHNPTAAVASLAFFEEAVAFCLAHDLALAHDFPYPDFGFDGGVIPSVLQADPAFATRRDRAKSCSIEFFSLSKSYNMGGFRVGYAIGNPELIAALRKLKAVIDFNQYRGILDGAIAALSGPQDCIAEANARFKERRDRFVAALAQIGWGVPVPETAMYVWAPLPEAWKSDSMGFCVELVRKTGVVASAGVGFGPIGEGYVRFALVHEPEILERAASLIGKFLQGRC
jgi:aspartate/methionine/tyrosine aminotransferase